MNRFSKSMLVAGVTVLSALLVAPSAQALDFKLHSINLSNPGELPEGIDPSDLLADSLKIPKLPLGFEMPEPGSMPGTPVACLQKGKLDIKRPSLPLITCSETIPVGKATSAALQEACTQNLEPMKLVDPGYSAVVVPLCPKAPPSLGTCIGAKGGSNEDSITISNHYHYTPQNLFEWIKSRKNCEKAQGKWYGLGSVFGFF
jgi:hypothetical protein